MELEFRAWSGWRMLDMEDLLEPIDWEDLSLLDHILLENDGFESYRLMQYIGLKDNKRTERYPNGQKIFDGDIVILDIGGSAEKYNPLQALLHLVEFKNSAWGFRPIFPDLIIEEDRKWQSFWQSEDNELWDLSYFKVIGNKFRNPELLKE